MKMIMNRNITVSSLSGHAIRFQRGVPVWVPPMMVEECMSKGALPADGEELPETKEKVEVPAPMGQARKDAFLRVFDSLVLKNDRNSFTAAGTPKVPVVRKALDFDFDVQELQTLWTQYQADLKATAAGDTNV